jgi:hypothetical protein
MRWGQAPLGPAARGLADLMREDAHGGLAQHASAPPAPAAGASVPAGQRPDRQPLPPRITPDALEQLSLRGSHQTLLAPRSTTRLPRATRPAGPVQADIRIPSPAPSPGGARPSLPSGAKSSRHSQGRPARRHSPGGHADRDRGPASGRGRRPPGRGRRRRGGRTVPPLPHAADTQIRSRCSDERWRGSASVPDDVHDSSERAAWHAAAGPAAWLLLLR